MPKYAPGFDFWNSEGDAEEICSQGNVECTVVYEKKLGGEKKCIENCQCLCSAWQEDINKMCTALGDCGSSVNFIKVKGYHDENAAYHGIDKEEETNQEEQFDVGVGDGVL